MMNHVRGSKGNVMLQVLAVAAVLGITFYFLTNYVIGQKKQVGQTINAVNLRFALNSTMDYVLFGIRQKYCFTDDNLLMNAPLSKCNLAHDGSIERLIMSIEQENFLRQLVALGKNIGNDIDKVRTTSMTRYLEVGGVTPEHPLYPVLKLLKVVRDPIGNPVKVGWIQVNIERDESPYLPRAGREVYLKAVISLKVDKTDKSPLVVGSSPLEITSKIAIYPREVGSFALMIPGSLHLDSNFNATMSQGDVALHRFGSRAELGTSTGLIFLSPVFVNGDIHVPVDNIAETADASTVQYSGVTFADRVYMGNGAVKTSGKEFRPKTAGGSTDRYWADMRTFGGFLKGIENDGAKDAGLEVVGKMAPSIPSNFSLMSSCVDWNLAQSSKDALYRSKVGANLQAYSFDGYKYRLYLSDKNQFSKQKNKLLNPEYQNFGTGTLTRNASDDNNAILKIKVSLGDRTAAAQIPNNSSITVKPQVNFPALQARYESDVAAAKTALAGAETKLAQLKAELADARNKLSAAESDLSAEQAKPAIPVPTPSPFDASKYRDAAVISSLNSRISNLKGQISNLANSQIPAQDSVVGQARTTLDGVEKVLANYMYIQSHPPELTVKVTGLGLGWGGYSKDKVNIEIEVKNATSFIDPNGNLVAPSIGMQAYDSTYQNSHSIFPQPNENLTGFINMQYNYNKTGFESPAQLAKHVNSNQILDSTYGGVDYDQLEYDCEKARNALVSQAFGGAEWTVSFAPSSRSSWNFAGDSSSDVGQDPVLNSIEFNGANSNFAAKNIAFRVHSIVGQCTIKASANFVTGFYTCDKLTIEPRATPLRIVGTFIVGKMTIDPTAIKAGIQWSTIYYPQATRELREAGVLQSVSGRDCDAPKSPIWHPIPAIQDVADRMKCNSISLRAKADPFQWTAVDPDCGLISSTSSNTSCKRRLIRFFVVEQSREGAK
jgi:hypothetical protein